MWWGRCSTLGVESEGVGIYFLTGAFGGDLTLFDSHACLDCQGLDGEREKGVGRTKPSNSPSPVVAQLGTTNQILSFSCVSLRASVTSWGFIAVFIIHQLLSSLQSSGKGDYGAYLLEYPACWQRQAVKTPSFPDR